MNDVQRPIAFIDSGVGGLTTFKSALSVIPNENTIYIGDELHLPYGPKSKDEIKKFVWQMIGFLMNENIKMLVIACNTATAAALTDLQKKLRIPVIGVINPGVQAAAKVTKNNKIGLIATEGTVKSNVYQKKLLEINGKFNVFSLAIPKFVSLVESGKYNDLSIKPIVAKELSPMLKKHIDTLIMGCTHYPLLKPFIQDVMGNDVSLIDSGIESVKVVQSLLNFYNLNNYKNNNPKHQFYTTGNIEHFNCIAKKWLNNDNFKSYHLNLGE